MVTIIIKKLIHKVTKYNIKYLVSLKLKISENVSMNQLYFLVNCGGFRLFSFLPRRLLEASDEATSLYNKVKVSLSVCVFVPKDFGNR